LNVLRKEHDTAATVLPSQSDSGGDDHVEGLLIVRVSVRDEQRYPDYPAAAVWRSEIRRQIHRARRRVRSDGRRCARTKRRGRIQGPCDGNRLLPEPGIPDARAIRQKYADADFIIIDGVPRKPRR
jgi:hypothetical protein